MRCSTLLTIFTGVLLYLVLGAVVFRALEVPHEEDQYVKLQITRQEYLDNYTCITPEVLQALIERLADALGSGADPTVNSTFTSVWDISSALFFSGTIITTIGYGNISPKTDGGKLFCIFYALFGIPMFGILLAGVGDHLGTGLRNAVAKVEMFLMKWKVSPTIVRVITAVLSILLGVVLFVAVPILVFQEVEQWTLLESAYYVVITLTTVGFGDYVAGDSGIAGSDHWYKPLVWFWILVGLAYFASILAMIGNWLRVLSKKTRAEMEELRAHATDWGQNIQNMSVDFRMPNIDDPFKRSTKRRRRHGHRSNSHGHSGSGTAGAREGERAREDGQQPNSGSGSSFGSYTSNESESESESDSGATQTDRVPDGDVEKEKENKPPLSDAAFCQPLDYFGENLAFIDESSDAVSGKVHLDPLTDSTQPNDVPMRKPKRRRPRRPAPQKSPKTSPTKPEKKEPNGDVGPPTDPPPAPPEP
ncbi:potassium channel subfamily K member 4 [Clupea harengus]|uniref:Potassium channel subfamily K member 4 n=1 Tax=Clupea harengus TaxID=7950 RepID=A0A6P3VWX8_CLUHA|nr:potassium channel subfamily K member 4 [Clupea harengus]